MTINSEAPAVISSAETSSTLPLPPPPASPANLADQQTHIEEDWADMIPEIGSIFGYDETDAPHSSITHRQQTTTAGYDTAVLPPPGPVVEAYIERFTKQTPEPPTPTPPAAIQQTVNDVLVELPKPAHALEPIFEEDVASEIPPVLSTTASSTSTLDVDTKRILKRLPSNLDKPLIQHGSVSVNRADPDAGIADEAADDVRSIDGLGMSIAIRQKDYDAEYELGRAYDAIVAGQTHVAIAIYEDVITNRPRNVDALFGLATTYHRIGMRDDALRYYDRLLKIAPNNRDAITNFLALVAEDSPADAIPHMEALEARNPDFSPIPAQIALARNALGDAEGAKAAMLRAIRLAPENLVYRYNLAIIFDEHGRYTEAETLYRQLIDAALKGQPVPAPLEDIQKRLTFIGSTG